MPNTEQPKAEEEAFILYASKIIGHFYPVAPDPADLGQLAMLEQLLELTRQCWNAACDSETKEASRKAMAEVWKDASTEDEEAIQKLGEALLTAMNTLKWRSFANIKTHVKTVELVPDSDEHWDFKVTLEP